MMVNLGVRLDGLGLRGSHVLAEVMVELDGQVVKPCLSGASRMVETLPA